MPQTFENPSKDTGNLVLVSEHRFVRDPGGAIWTPTQVDYAFWRAYVQSCRKVTVAARVSDVGSVSAGYRRADGKGVTFEALPAYIGPVGFVASLPRIIYGMSRSARGARLVLLRGPGVLSAAMWMVARLRRTPFAVEVLGDNEAVFRDGLVGGRAALLYGSILGHLQRRICWEAVAVSYVTGATLQRKYPNRAGREFAVSDVVLGADGFAANPRTYREVETLRLVLVGSLEQPYKGVDIALRAIQRATIDRQIELVVVGDGRLKAGYQELAAALGIESQVHFVGSVPAGDGVRAHLRAADLFIMPSRTEGLPRALIEAMAMALPAVAARVGGVPELLDETQTFTREGVAELADILTAITPKEMSLMSEANLDRARAFSLDEISGRHAAFILATLGFVRKASRREDRGAHRDKARRVA